MNTSRILTNVLFGSLLSVSMALPAANASVKSDTSNTSAEQGAGSSAVTDARLDGKLEATVLLNANKGVVTLKGIVNSQEESNLVATVARNTEGAKSVTDKMKLES